MPQIWTSLETDFKQAFKVTTPPAIEPVTAAECKLFARIDGNSEDSLIENFISATRAATELYLRRALINQTITLYLDTWPPAEDFVSLPRPPLVSVSSISTIDEDGTATTYDTDNYYVDTYSDPGRIIIKSGATAPSNVDRYHSGYKIIYVAGYGSAASDVPILIREGIKLWVAIAYEDRRINIKEPPPEVLAMLQIYRNLTDI